MTILYPSESFLYGGLKVQGWSRGRYFWIQAFGRGTQYNPSLIQEVIEFYLTGITDHVPEKLVIYLKNINTDSITIQESLYERFETFPLVCLDWEYINA